MAAADVREVPLPELVVGRIVGGLRGFGGGLGLSDRAHLRLALGCEQSVEGGIGRAGTESHRTKVGAEGGVELAKDHLRAYGWRSIAS